MFNSDGDPTKRTGIWADRIAESEKLGEKIMEMESTIADLTGALDDIPPLTLLMNAIQELQEQYPAPAATFIWYLGNRKNR